MYVTGSLSSLRDLNRQDAKRLTEEIEMDQFDERQMLRRAWRIGLKLLPYWLWAVALMLWALALMLIVHGIAEGNWISPIFGVLTAVAGRAVKRLVRNFPDDDDDDDYDDTIYHGVPVGFPEPLDEDRSDKPYIDRLDGWRT